MLWLHSTVKNVNRYSEGKFLFVDLGTIYHIHGGHHRAVCGHRTRGEKHAGDVANFESAVCAESRVSFHARADDVRREYGVPRRADRAP